MAEACIELRLKLADGLKARRSRKKLTQVELAKSLGSSQSRVAKEEMFGGRLEHLVRPHLLGSSGAFAFQMLE
jgi:hypothetical protein